MPHATDCEEEPLMTQSSYPPSEKSTNGRAYPSSVERQSAAPAALLPLLIRSIEPADSDALQYAFQHDLSPTSRYQRFHAAISRLPDRLVHYLTHVDGVDHVALVAFMLSNTQPSTGVGVARFVRIAGQPHSAELAIAVVDHAQGLGIGRRLLEQLGRAARERDIDTFTLVVLNGNQRVRAWLRRLGAEAHRSEAGVITYQLPVGALETNSRNSPRSSAA
jgi:ribosomal protein S18 acetylase RimI-like enzyme